MWFVEESKKQLCEIASNMMKREHATKTGKREELAYLTVNVFPGGTRRVGVAPPHGGGFV